MTTIVLGTNRVSDCRTLISLRQQSLLRVDTNPLRVSLTTPPQDPSVRHIRIVENVAEGDGEEQGARVQVVVQEASVAIFHGDHVFASAFQTDADTVNLSLDLRLLGINVYTDVAGLHIGENTLRQNTFVNCDTAINLG